MIEDVTVAYPDEDYREVERMFHQLAPNALNEYGEASQYARLFQFLVPRIRKSAEEDRLSAVELDDRLRQAEEVIDDIAGALQANAEDRELGEIWSQPGPDQLESGNGQPAATGWSGPSPVDASLLDKAAAAYLERPWMQLNYLDRCILNGFIFDRLARLRDKEGLRGAAGPVDWAYHFSGGDVARQLVWRMVFGAAKFLIRWIAMPLAIAAIYYLESQEIGVWMAALYTIYLAIHIAISPSHGENHHSLVRFIDRRKRVDDLKRLYRNSSVDVIHPSRLRDLISEVEARGTDFRPVIYSILDRAIARDATALAIENVG